MKVTNNTVRLCCGGKGCPVVKVNNDQVAITDDFGNTIKITKEQASLIPKAIEKLSPDLKS